MIWLGWIVCPDPHAGRCGSIAPTPIAWRCTRSPPVSRCSACSRAACSRRWRCSPSSPPPAGAFVRPHAAVGDAARDSRRRGRSSRCLCVATSRVTQVLLGQVVRSRRGRDLIVLGTGIIGLGLFLLTKNLNGLLTSSLRRRTRARSRSCRGSRREQLARPSSSRRSDWSAPSSTRRPGRHGRSPRGGVGVGHPPAARRQRRRLAQGHARHTGTGRWPGPHPAPVAATTPSPADGVPEPAASLPLLPLLEGLPGRGRVAGPRGAGRAHDLAR